MSFELESHVNEHGRAYQQGSGQQYNIDRAYFGYRDPSPPVLFIAALGSLVREADPLELGVHRAAILDGNAVPEYVTRDIDESLTGRVGFLAQHGGLLLIVGDSTAGKSRAAYQALLRAVPEYRLIAPYDRGELRESLASIVMGSDKTVLWLDNFERYLGAEGLTPRIAVQLKRIGVLTIGTIRTKEYRGLASLSATRSPIDSRRHEELLSAEDVLKQAEVVSLERRWSLAETAHAREIHDPRIVEALQHHELYGIAEYLAAGPKLYEEWSLAAAVDANPRGAALVSAAIDCQRAGIQDAVPLEILRSVHEYYLTSAGGQLLRPEAFENALAWATQRRYGVTSLLLPGKKPQSYRAFDYLIDQFISSDDVPPVPDEIWDTLRQSYSAEQTQLNGIAIAAANQKNYNVAESIWHGLAESDSRAAVFNLGLLMLALDRSEEAERWLERAVDLGSATAATRLGHLLDSSERREEAERWYERAALSDDPHGMYHMGIICRNSGMDDDAEKWFRKAVEHKERWASSSLGELLVSSGRLEEAESLLRASADKGDQRSMVQLGNLFADLKRTEEAEELWRRAADLGSGPAKANLAMLWTRQGRNLEAADRLFNEAMADDVKGVLGSYSVYLAKRGRWSQAEDLAQQAFDDGITKVGVDIADVLFDANRFDAAETWLRKALTAGDHRAVSQLAMLLERTGRMNEAEAYWKELADGGDADATFALAKLKLAAADLDEAILLFRKCAEEERDATAACELARLYWRRSDMDSVEEWLKFSYNEGHLHAACLLGGFYRENGQLKDAERYWKLAYKGGHTDSASYLASFLMSQGRGRDAAVWLRRSRQVEAGRPDRKKRQRNKSRRRR